jgi:ethanolamine ammonia-lyase small subunit
MTELRRNDRIDLLAAARERTPARLFAGRAGAAYRTATHLELRRDHAAARDAVQAEVALADLPADLVAQFGLFDVTTLARSKEEFLLRPDRGRRFSELGGDSILQHCPAKVDLQIAVGDGLSATAVVAQVPALLPLLLEGARTRGWKTGTPFLIHHCRVGVINEIGELLRHQSPNSTAVYAKVELTALRPLALSWQGVAQ